MGILSGRTEHYLKRYCSFKGYKCKVCGKKGHLASQCKSKSDEKECGDKSTKPGKTLYNKGKKKFDSKIKQVNESATDSDNEDDNWEVFTVKAITGEEDKPVKVNMDINGRKV
ncbi:hypothetical protein HOLleu_31936 [Holothuria leucospilota]|uniref:CCHC-type domain-containing protein n=1 Tax=Holothuria leucospilota TaxID=206669 RepID=A0A9Q1BII2_HOLLE|nr:hypothetical protein HOLleu_31936 [Holothuria leucospilota]